MRETAITIVFVKTIGGTIGCALKTSARQNENVHPAVIVVVDERAATTSRLDKILLLLRPAVDDRGTQPHILPNIHKTSMERATGSRGSRQCLSAVCAKPLPQAPLTAHRTP